MSNNVTLKPKSIGLGLELRTFTGDSGQAYMVMRSREGSYHVFAEVEAKAAARDCGATGDKNTRELWKSLWDK
jgi:hypothetical protein